MATRPRRMIGPPLLVRAALTVLVLLVAATHAQDYSANDEEEQQAACVLETAALQSDSGVEAAMREMQDSIATAIQDDFFQFCSVFQRSCTVDLNDYSESVRTACTEAEGQVATQSGEQGLECNGKVLGIPIPGGVEVSFSNVPTCVGPSCDPDNLPSVVEETIQKVLSDEVAPVVEEGLQDGNCTSVSGVAGTGNTLAVAAAVSIVGALGSILG
jgi:hypothetical protein